MGDAAVLRHVRRARWAAVSRGMVALLGAMLLGAPVDSDGAPGDIRTIAGGAGQGPGIDVAQQPSRLVSRGAWLFIADVEHDVIRRYDTQTGEEVVVAGSGTQGFAGDGGPATEARLLNPSDVALDGDGDLLIADLSNQRIRRVDHATGIITTLAGSGARGSSGDGGPATAATFDFPSGIAADRDGNVFVADSGGNRVRRIDARSGVVTTVAGTGLATFGGDGGLATEAHLYDPVDVELDASGNLFIIDLGNRRVRRVNAATGVITTVAGTGTTGSGGDGGLAVAAQLAGPSQVVVDAGGSLFIADASAQRIRRVDSATGTIATVAGSGAAGFGGDGAAATSAALNRPSGVAVDGEGTVFIADGENLRVRRVVAGTIDTVAGNGTRHFGGDGRVATAAQLGGLTRVAVDAAGAVLIADTDNHRVRRVDRASGIITTIAGTGVAGFAGDGGPATQATLSSPSGLAVDGAGNVVIADLGNLRVRRVDAASGVITTVAGTGVAGSDGDGGPATAARLRSPYDVALDGAGNVFVADAFEYRVRRIDASTGVITTIAGTSSQGFSGDGGPAVLALLRAPEGLAIDQRGDLVIADTGNLRLRSIDGAGVISTIAGSGTRGFAGDGGPATAAAFDLVYAVAVGPLDDLYVADSGNARVRRIDALTGIVWTVAGTGVAGFGGDGHAATAALLAYPTGVAVDASGDLLIADPQNRRLREVESPSVPTPDATGSTATAATQAPTPQPTSTQAAATRSATPVPPQTPTTIATTTPVTPPLRVPADYPSIQAAIDAASDGATIAVAPGTYFEHLDYHAKAIDVVSESGPATTIIDGGGDGTVVRFASGETRRARVRGFTIRNGREMSFDGAGIYVYLASPTITDNVITENHGCSGSGIFARFAAPLIQRNVITHNERTTCTGGGGGGGISLQGGGGAQVIDNELSYNLVPSGWAGALELFGAGAAVVRGNVFVGNSAAAEGGAMVIVGPSTPTIADNLFVANSAIQQGGGVSLSMFNGSDRPVFVNNTFDANSAPNGSALYVNGFDDDAIVANNLIVGTSDQTAVYCGSRYTPATPLLRFNDVWAPAGVTYGGACGDLTGVAGNVSVDPLFVDGAAGDYHLRFDSPLVDAGSTDAAAGILVDFDGDPRVIDGDGIGAAIVDVGFDEVAHGIVAFERLAATTQVRRTRAAGDKLVMRSTLTLGATSAGIAPQIEDVRLVARDDAGVVFTAAPPSTSFLRLGARQRYKSTISVDGAIVTTLLSDTGLPGRFTFRVRARGLRLDHLPATALTITLRIGDDAGEVTSACTATGSGVRCR